MAASRRTRTATPNACDNRGGIHLPDYRVPMRPRFKP
ncbi:MAG: hypothetical protein FD160_4195, partial [Caulobacteraceae bacterium]